MTDDQLTAIHQRRKMVITGPWTIRPCYDEYNKEMSASVCIPGLTVMGEFSHEDADFITHSLQDVVDLLTEVARLRTLLKQSGISYA